MKTSLLSIIMLLVSVAIMAMPASAEEVTITFDEGRLEAGDPIGSTYSDLGVTFVGAKVVDTKILGTDLGFTPTGVCTINFSPYVTSVTVEFKDDAAKGYMNGLLVNGQQVSDSDFSLLWGEKTLQIKSNTQNPIKSVQLYGKEYTCLCTKIQFDNLSYNQIPEFPTVALPVAAVLGLIFVFQRRKE